MHKVGSRNVVNAENIVPLNLQNLYIFVLRANVLIISPSKVYFFPRVIRKYIQNLQILQGCILRILQHFAIKFCNFANFNMILLAVLIDFVDQNLLYTTGRLKKGKRLKLPVVSTLLSTLWSPQFIKDWHLCINN